MCHHVLPGIVWPFGLAPRRRQGSATHLRKKSGQFSDDAGTGRVGDDAAFFRGSDEASPGEDRQVRGHSVRWSL